MVMLIAMLLAQTPQPRLFLQPNLRRSRSEALGATYSWSPSFGSVACACDGTDAPGLTFDGGSAYCTKRNEWTGIVPTDMVLCGLNIPRLMPGGDGTGAIGLQAWRETANQLVRSQAFDNASWVKGNFNTSNPSIQANACLAPDNTMTGEIVHWPATTGGGTRYSFMLQSGLTPSFNVRTVYARAVQADGGAWANDGGIIDGGFIIAAGNLSYGGFNCFYTSAGFTRCRQFDTDAGQIGEYMYMTVDSDQGATVAQDVCLWQADVTQNLEQSVDLWPPPVLTVASNVTRGADVAWFDGVVMPQWDPYLISANLLTETGFGPTAANDHPAMIVEATTSVGQGGSKLLRSNAKASCSQGNDINAVIAYSTGTLTASENTYTCSYDGVSVLAGNAYVSACANGTDCGDAGRLDAGVAVATRFMIGSRNDGTGFTDFANGVVKSVSITSPSRKDVYLFGDSLVLDATASNGSRPEDIIRVARGTAVATYNEGVNGTDTAQCRTSLLDRLGYIIDAGAQSRTYFMLQCGHNNIRDAGTAGGGAGAGALGDLTDALAIAQDAGVHIIGSTVPPAGLVAETVTVNTGLQTWGATYGVTIADTYTPLKAGDGTLNPAYDYGDHTHLNDAGVYVETAVWLQAGGW